MKKIKLFLPIIILMISGCASTSDLVRLKISIETFDEQSKPLAAECTLFSTTSKLDVRSPNDIVYMASCGPINVFCTRDNLKGEYGVIPRPADSTGEKLLVTSGIGYAFDRIVDTVTPFGAILNYSSSFYSDGDESCILPRKIKIILK